MKFNFNDYKGKFAMHCKTAKEAKEFCRYMHSHGRMWNSFDSYADKTNWNEYFKEQTVYYFNDGRCGTVEFAKECGYTVLEWEDYV